jgi:hypothetical protein
MTIGGIIIIMGRETSGRNFNDAAIRCSTVHFLLDVNT